MITDTTVNAVANIIQLAIAPVFLLAGIAGILNVLAARLARIVDRARSLETDVPIAQADVRLAELKELVILDRRMSMIHWAIGLCTAAALFICLVVMILFVADLVGLDFAVPVSVLFVLAMLSVTLGLLLFLGEVTIATRFVRVNERFVSKGKVRYGGES